MVDISLKMCIRDSPGTDAQGTLEQTREAEHVIDLVGEIAAAGSHHADTARLGLCLLYTSEPWNGWANSVNEEGKHEVLEPDEAMTSEWSITIEKV